MSVQLWPHQIVGNWLEQLAKAEDKHLAESERKKAYQHAQDHFICAAQMRSFEAAFRAADLGDRGLARKLDVKTAQQYYAAASLGGNKSASFAMAKLLCGGDTNSCKEPLEARKWLQKAARQGSEEEPQILAIFLEMAEGGAADMTRAAACYKLAEERGDKWSRQNYMRLSVDLGTLKSSDCLTE